MRSFVFLIGVLLSSQPAHGLGVRENGGNCEGTKSCRPRCIGFQLDREMEHCSITTGIFSVGSRLNPWDIKRFRTFNCPQANTCFNDNCGQNLEGDLTIRVGEKGQKGPYYFTAIEIPSSSHGFTYCSVYPCTKEECALPEQLGFELQFEFFRGSIGDYTPTPLLVQKIFLESSFTGAALQSASENQFGPLIFDWLDDPTNCRPGQFPETAPFLPVSDPSVTTNAPNLDPALYCQGDEYSPAPLPSTMVPTPPTIPPTPSPSTTAYPSPSPSFSEGRQDQLDGLEELYQVTRMGELQSQDLHHWFEDLNYCSFTGVDCDSSGFVIGIDLSLKRLTGSLPSMLSFPRLRKLKLVGNDIGGFIPSTLGTLPELQHVELAVNRFTGPIPVELSSLLQLRRLMLQHNQLHGNIPMELCEAQDLTALDVSGNSGMHGGLPECLGDLPLEVLRVDDIGLVGTVPSQLCGLRSMNGLNPNVFGCDAIACPEGMYEATNGRQSDASSACILCDVPSNVVGSRTCKVVPGDPAFSYSPTALSIPTYAPIAGPIITGAPSTEHPTGSTTTEIPTRTPSLHPTVKPTIAVPVETSEPPSAPPIANIAEFPISPTEPTQTPHHVSTSSPSMQKSEGITAVRLILIFQGASTLLETEEKATFERVTQSFLVEETQGIIDSVTVMAQSVEPYYGEAVVLLVGNRHLNEESEFEEVALLVDLAIVGRSVTSAGFGDVVEVGFDDFDAYLDSLGNELDEFSGLTTMLQKLEDPPGKVAKPTEPKYWLFGVTLGLAALAVVAVGMLVRSRQAQQELERAFRTDLRQRAPTTDEVEHALAIHMVAANDHMSDESSSGWDSTSSPGVDELGLSTNETSRAIIATPERRAWSQGFGVMSALATPALTLDVANTPIRSGAGGGCGMSVGTSIMGSLGEL